MKKLKPHAVDWAQIDRFLASADKKLASARKILAFDEEACLQQAYEAMLKASLGFMFSHGVTIDGGEIGGNTALSADAVAFCVRVFMHLAPRGRRLDLERWGYGFAARFHRGSMRNVALKSLCKVGSVVRVDLRVVPTTR